MILPMSKIDISTNTWRVLPNKLLSHIFTYQFVVLNKINIKLLIKFR